MKHAFTIIGAGPSGLAAAIRLRKHGIRLRKHGIPVKVFEMSPDVRHRLN
jgi:cation diffusion facilitator CzcD-associated flavoprotein CzcO